MAQVSPVADDERGFFGQLGDNIGRRPESPHQLDAAIGERGRGLGEAVEHEGEMPLVRIGIGSIQPERANNGLVEIVRSFDRVLERGVVGFALALLHPVENVAAIVIGR